MEENEIGKIVVDAAVKVHPALGASLRKDGIKRMADGLEDGNLGVLGSLRDPSKRQPGGAGNPAWQGT